MPEMVTMAAREVERLRRIEALVKQLVRGHWRESTVEELIQLVDPCDIPNCEVCIARGRRPRPAPAG